MPFHRRFRPINKTDKHEVTWTALAENASAVKTITIADAVPVADKDAGQEVSIGSHITWIYFEFHFSAQVTTNPKTIHWQVISNPLGMTIGTPSSVYQNDRSYIMKRGMEMLPSDQSTVFKRIFTVKIPRIYQRQKDGNKILFRYIASSAETINSCGVVIYKERY